MNGSLGVNGLYSYEGDPQAADTDVINPEKGAIILDQTNGQLHIKSGARGSNTDAASAPAVRTVVAEGGATLTDGATITGDTNVARYLKVTIEATGRTLTLTNGKVGRQVFVAVTQGSGGSKTITTYTNVIWSGGTLPTLTTTAGRTDLLRFIWDGTRWLGSTVALNYTTV